MNRRIIMVLMSFLLSIVAFSWGAEQVLAQQQSTLNEPLADFLARISGRVTPSQQKAAAASAAAARTAAEKRARENGYELPQAIPPGPGDQPDYYTVPNWANTPPIRKFVDTLPGLGSGSVNNLGQYMPVANPDTTTYAGSDYYEIGIREYTERMHTDLPNGTRLRGYYQINNGTVGTTDHTSHYLGPMIIATKDKPVRIKFVNELPLTGAGGELFVPVDTSIMGSGEFDVNYNLDTLVLLPGANNTGTFSQNRALLHLHGGRTPWISDGTPHQWITPAGEVTTYPKGISVEYVPDMWFNASGATITSCAGDLTCGVAGATNNPGDGAQTYYYTNAQSARLMFYHDHAWGITRLNVYVGEAAGYLIQDPVELALINGGTVSGRTYSAGTIPAASIPLIIQDKTFVDGNPSRPTYVRATDPTWAWGTGAIDPVNGYPTPVTGDLWWPHVYMPAQNPYNPDGSGVNPFGRWHYGPWFWPPTPVCGSSPDAVPPLCVTYGAAPNLYYDEQCNVEVTGFCQPPFIPGTPNVSWGAEAFLDTMIVNGTAYPRLEVTPQAYRFRILNASHDRFLNLQLYKARPIVSSITLTNGGSGYTDAPAVTFTGGNGTGATATATVENGVITDIALDTVGSGYTTVPTVNIAAPPAGGTQASAIATIYTSLTEVGMVPASLTTGFPPTWPADGREGGVPDPATAGPAFIQIGTEGGFLPAPVVLNNQPVQWNLDPTMFNVGNVLQQADGGGTVILGAAERADVIVDFSQYAGQTLILYNDAPTAFPALVPQYDYYTGAPDRTDTGGARTILPGVAPNIRTVMQIVVSGTPSPTPPPNNAYNTATLANLQSAFQSTGTPGVFEASQDPIIVGQSAYNSAYNTIFPSTWPDWGLSRISDTSLSFFQTDGTPVSNYPIKPKAVHDEMGETFDDYGRMSAKIGLTVPFANAANAAFALQNYVDPPTEIIPEGATQIWKITHNGVDAHPIHFHLFDVQLLNRVGWDGFIRLPDPNELGWKDTVRMAPLEDTIVALRPVKPPVPFTLPDSIRPLNPATPLDTTTGFSQIDPLTAGPVATPQTNQIWNFGWEYVWHCHILSHEENDMMRSMVFDVPINIPTAPTVLTAALAPPPPATGTQVQLSWTTGEPTVLNPNDEIGFRIERCVGAGCTFPATPPYYATVYSGVTTFTDVAVSPGTTYNYRVRAFNALGVSATSNVVEITMAAWTGAVDVNLVASPGTPALVGTAVLFTANCVGNTVPCQYRFSLDGVTKKNYGSLGVENNWILPSSTPPGTYRVLVEVRTDVTSLIPDTSAFIDYQLTGGVRLFHLGVPTNMNTVALAFADAVDTDTIQAWGVQFNELPINFSPVTAATVTFSGGWNSIYSLEFPANLFMTTLQGPLTIGGAGTLIVENLIIR